MNSPLRTHQRPARLGRFARAVALLGLVATMPASAHADDADKAVTDALAQINGVSGGLPSIDAAVKATKAGERTAAQRIADAMLLLGSKDYDRAINVLHEVLERHANDPRAVPDATYLLGEAYFKSNQLLAARRSFKKVADKAGDPGWDAFTGKAVGRLVDVALRTGEYEKLDEVFSAINKVPPGSVTAGVSYAKGKALLAKKDLGGAKAALSAVDEKSEFFHQAKYMLALIAAKEATPAPVPRKEGEPIPSVPRQRYAGAIDLFKGVTLLPGDTEEHRQVIDLAWLAVGRLFYETDQYAQAVQAYNRIDRTSPEFGTMQYELAWVYVRMGDTERALRALELLSVSDPKNQNIAEGSLLRADLMLRAGMFDKSLTVYEGVRSTYDPIREKVEAFLGASSDPGVYYEKLASEQLDGVDGGGSGNLPALAIQWAKESDDGPRAFAIMDDIKSCRELIKHSNELIERINVVIASPNRVRAFPELKSGMEKATGLLNRVSMARRTLGRGLESANGSDLSGDIGQWRTSRRSMEKRLELLPINDSDFQEREDQATRQWNTASQGVQRLELQVDALQATVNGLRRVLREAPQQNGVVRDPNSIVQFEAELVNNEKDLATYRGQLDSLRKLVTHGKLQVGFGDQRFVDDAETRIKYREAITNEVRLAGGGAGGQALSEYARKAQPVLDSALAAEQKVEKAMQDLDAEIGKRTTELKGVVQTETQNMVSYSVRLDGLDKEARVLVGEIAMRNFGLVRDRLKSIVLRADVGVTELAWEVREEQITRVRALRVERAREDKLLREELNEVLDDAGEEESK